MQCNVIRLFVPIFLLCAATWGMAQQQPPSNPQPGAPGAPPQTRKPPAEKSKLEEMIAEALKNNPDIRVAAAKLAEADAELNRTRLQVSQKIVSLHTDLAHQKAEVDYRQSQFERYKELGEQRAIDAKLVEEARQNLALAKAKLAATEAELPFLLGKSNQADRDLSIQEARLRREEARLRTIQQLVKSDLEFIERAAFKTTGPMAERIRKALQTPVKVDYKDMTFDAILNDLSKKVDGLAFRNLFQRGGELPEGKMNLRFEQALPVSAILQALADETGCLFFVRDYGIVVTTGNGAPHGAMKVEEFLRQKPAEK